MKMQSLSPETLRRVNLLFEEGDRASAIAMLTQECGNNLPLLGNADMFALERFQFAALNLSNGTLVGLTKAVSLAKEDWRDLLMSAGFGDVTAHKRWLPTGHAE